MTSEAALAEAVAAAAALLGDGRRVAIGGLETDVAGVSAAIQLARRLGASVDHSHAGAALRDLTVMRQAGWIVTTPLQARARADFVLLVGACDAAWPDLATRLALDARPPLAPERDRGVARLAARSDAGDLLTQLGLLRAAVGGRALGSPRLAELAKAMLAARYGVAVWSAGDLQGIEIEMLCGLVDDLNATTRFAGLPIPAAGNGAAAMQVSAWLTGLPLPLGFAAPGGAALHDAGRFDAARRLASGEADAAIWIATLGETTMPWPASVPTVAITSGAAEPRAAVAIVAGRPGVDHDAVLFDADLGALAARAASRRSDLPSAAAILSRIDAALAA